MKQPKSMAAKPEGKRSYVFLQGPTSVAFRDLGRELLARGHKVLKVNFCPGDWIFWRGEHTVMYRGGPAGWPAYLRDLLTRHGATDIVYFADRFPYHKAAQRVAREMGVRAVSMEYGYLRPDWLILEEGGQSTYSHVPATPEAIREKARGLQPVDTTPLYPINLSEEALFEATFHLSNAFFGILTPRYRPKRYYPVMIEFPAYIPRLIRRSLNARPADDTVKALGDHDGPRFLVTLQMQNDYQLRDNAPKGFQQGFVRDVLTSFRDHAPQNALLVFKLHPMDNGIENWPKRVKRMAAQMGLADRVWMIDGGGLGDIFQRVEGVVVINSTTGLTAVRAGLPVKAMGVAVYDMPGLTFQGSLDSFWTDPTPPERKLVLEFVRVMAEGIHVRGTVYGEEGRAAFVRNAAERLEGDQINRHGLYEPVPPRIAQARAMGIMVDWPLENAGGAGDAPEPAPEPAPGPAPDTPPETA